MVKRLTDSHPPEPGRRTYLDGVRAAAPIGVSALAFGVSFGVLARSADMGRVAPIVMSVTTFAGSAQFAVVSVLGAGGTAAAEIGAAVLLNARYGPMALAASEAAWSRPSSPPSCSTSATARSGCPRPRRSRAPGGGGSSPPS